MRVVQLTVCFSLLSDDELHREEKEIKERREWAKKNAARKKNVEKNNTNVVDKQKVKKKK